MSYRMNNWHTTLRPHSHMTARAKSPEPLGTLSTRVAGLVERHLIESRLQPGDRLPTERNLACKFGVSRTVVREAVRALVAKGMLEVRHGSGMTIRSPTVELLSTPLAMILKSAHPGVNHEKIMEVRRLLEVEIAGLAAQRRTARDVADLTAIVENTAGIRTNRERFVQWDVSFHAGLASATQNQLFVLLLESVVSIMRQVRELGFEVSGTQSRAIRHHTAILNAVAAGDPAQARKAMLAHLEEAEGTMHKALGAMTGTEPGPTADKRAS